MNEQARFIVTKELGKLAKWLRILGFDTLYCTSSKKSVIIITSLQDNRIIITKNKRWGTRQGVRIVFIKSDFYKHQLKQVIETLGLGVNKDDFFMRCVLCNRLLEAIEKEKVRDRVPEYVLKTELSFVICPACQRIYWKGTHWGNVDEILSNLKLYSN